MCVSTSATVRHASKPRSRIGAATSAVSAWNDDGQRWDRVRYDVRFDFTIRVPRDAALRLCTINGGDVIVNGTRGDFDVDNVNGLIEMNQVAGAGSAHTVNGAVTVTFTANPKQPSSFKTRERQRRRLVPGWARRLTSR